MLGQEYVLQFGVTTSRNRMCWYEFGSTTNFPFLLICTLGGIIDGLRDLGLDTHIEILG